MLKQRFDFLFVDFMVEDSHRVYCNSIINEINKNCSSVVIEKRDYIDYREDEYHKVFEINTREIVGNYPIKARVNTFYNYCKALKIAKRYEYKKVVVLGYDPVMFLLMYKTLSSLGELYVVEHHQLDEVSISGWKKRIWEHYKLQTNHILLDDAIVDITAKDFSIPKDKICVFPHPCIFDSKKIEKTTLKSNMIKVLCISQSNDPKQMQELVNSERETKFFENNNIKVVIRYNDLWKANDLKGFEIINGFLPEVDYNRLNEECDIVLMPFPLEYRYRCSGTLIDALAAGKKVVSSFFAESQSYSTRFGKICRTYTSIKEIGSIVLELNTLDDGKSLQEFGQYQKLLRERGIGEIIKEQN